MAYSDDPLTDDNRSDASPWSWPKTDEPSSSASSPLSERQTFTQDPMAELGTVIQSLATGAEPNDFHPSIQPLAKSLSVLFDPKPDAGLGLLGSPAPEGQGGAPWAPSPPSSMASAPYQALPESSGIFGGGANQRSIQSLRQLPATGAAQSSSPAGAGVPIPVDEVVVTAPREDGPQGFFSDLLHGHFRYLGADLVNDYRSLSRRGGGVGSGSQPERSYYALPSPVLTPQYYNAVQQQKSAAHIAEHASADSPQMLGLFAAQPVMGAALGMAPTASLALLSRFPIMGAAATLGQEFGYGALYGVPGAGAGSALFAKDGFVPQIILNKAAGDAHEAEVLSNILPQSQTNIQPQVTILSNGPSGLKVRLDALGHDISTGDVVLTDAKASPTAPLTPNQTVVYPELEAHGGVVVGQGKVPHVGGTQIPPTKVQIIRQNQP